MPILLGVCFRLNSPSSNLPCRLEIEVKKGNEGSPHIPILIRPPTRALQVWIVRMWGILIALPKGKDFYFRRRQVVGINREDKSSRQSLLVESISLPTRFAAGARCKQSLNTAVSLQLSILFLSLPLRNIVQREKGADDRSHALQSGLPGPPHHPNLRIPHPLRPCSLRHPCRKHP